MFRSSLTHKSMFRLLEYTRVVHQEKSRKHHNYFTRYVTDIKQQRDEKDICIRAKTIEHP